MQIFIKTERICLLRLGKILRQFDPTKSMILNSSGSRGRVRGGAEKHEIYVAAFGSHLFYDLFLQGQGGPWPPRPPLDPLLLKAFAVTDDKDSFDLFFTVFMNVIIQ